MSEKLKDVLKRDGRSLKWFYDNYVRDRLSITYVYMTAQLNGFNTLTVELETAVTDYLDALNVKTQSR